MKQYRASSEDYIKIQSTVIESPSHKIPMRDLAGKIAFITGGSSGIGLGIVRACIAADMSVALTFRTRGHWDRAQQTLKGNDDRVYPIFLDVTDRQAMLKAADLVVCKFGKVHVLINNAGIDPGVPISTASFDDLTWCLDVNVKGVFSGIHAFLPHLKAHGEGGHIVTTASINGLVASSLWGLYSMSKFAVVGMMESLRSELKDDGIGVSVFCPGRVVSELGNSNRNRPSELCNHGVLSAGQRQSVEAIKRAICTLALRNGGVLPMMDPEDAGNLVLKGIRENDLYIISHSEYARTIRDRSEAILASIPSEPLSPPDRAAIADLERCEIYSEVLSRKSAAK